MNSHPQNVASSQSKMSGAKEFDNTMRISKLTLKLCGMGLGKPKNTWAEYFKNTWMFYFNMLILYTAIIGEILWIVKKMQVGIHFNEVTYSIPCFTFSILGTIKTVSILKNEVNVVNFLKRLKELHPNLKEEKHKFNDKDEENLNKYCKDAIRTLNLIINILAYTNSLLFVTVIFTPAIIMIYIYFKSGQAITLYPILVFYPYINSSDIRIWPMAYVHQSYSGK